VERASRKNNSAVNARRIFERSTLKVFVSGREADLNFPSQRLKFEDQKFSLSRHYAALVAVSAEDRM